MLSSTLDLQKARVSFLQRNESLSNSVEEGAKRLFNRLRGKMQKPLVELLQSYGLPKGLFPRNATHYEFEEDTGKLTVFMPTICEVGFKDSSVVRYAVIVTGTLSQGKLLNIEGLKTKVLVWAKVTSVAVDSTASKISFTVGVKKTRPFDAYDVLRDGIEVEVF
ncbi:hypothetical protein L7F22_054372 [Adiantum nelumboides]|nr:hypothetical protein [Adiantum nelumboides]